MEASLDKLESLKNVYPPKLDARLLEMMAASLSPSKSYRNSFLVKKQNAFVPVNIDDIMFCSSEDGITLLNGRSGNRWIVDHSLDYLETDLDPKLFFRINRKQIIKKTTITKVHPYFNHRFKLEMNYNHQTDFIVARKRSKAFKDWMEGL